MSYRPNTDYNIDVRMGLIVGHSMITIRGHDDSVPAGGPFGLSPEFGAGSYVFDQSAISATPAVVGVGSTDNTNDIAAGTGALTVRVTGLDASGDAQTNDVTMTGQTAANTADTFSAVFEVLVLTTGANNANTGVIYVGTGTFTAGIPAVRMLSMEVGYNRSTSAYYVVPNAKTLYLRSLIATVSTTNKDVEVVIKSSVDGILWITELPYGAGSGNLVTPITAWPALVAGTHLKIDATGTAASTDVAAVLEGELVDD
jgi:hypothetical protein